MDRVTTIGHVHNRPAQVSTSSYTYPLGASLEEIERIVSQFMTAFTPIRIEFVEDGREHVWDFNNEDRTFTKI